MKNNSGKLKIAIAVLSVAIVLCGLLIVWFLIVSHDTGGTIARVYQNSVVVHEVDLSKVNEAYTYRVEGENGAYNEILVEPGQISCKGANCPDQICVKTGTINSDLLPITCLPHKVLVQIEME